MAITWDDAGPARVRFTVYRETWARGGHEGTRLLGEDGMRCCMGHLARDLGVADAACLDRSITPRRAYGAAGFQPLPDPAVDRYLRVANSGASFVAVNDDPSIPDGEREALLTEMFADQGIDVTFVD